ncbi:class I SAM-dependent methyltransferase [Ketobacter nezhaii]|uniref:class I SAM-dependent methyltransferase n=1 Tax=Ketobacter sp. MCCC 1A13808 TaxID=2602738 RepID=UPI0018DC6D40|nr:class I SAM-dependent methyltransferase [Ketobacter sp. MCCC 1A13808]
MRYINQDELKAVFDQQASGYEKQQMKLAPIHDGLYFQLEWIFSELPQTAQILCVGLGTGSELSYLASRFPKWRFTAVEPSTAMLDVCRQRAEKEGYISRCRFHEGYLESLPDVELHDAATCFMVSQFILENEARSNFFRAISERLKNNAILVSADLSSSLGTPEYKALLKVWVSMLHAANAPAEAIKKHMLRGQKTSQFCPPMTLDQLLNMAVLILQFSFIRRVLFTHGSQRGRLVMPDNKKLHRGPNAGAVILTLYGAL